MIPSFDPESFCCSALLPIKTPLNSLMQSVVLLDIILFLQEVLEDLIIILSKNIGGGQKQKKSQGIFLNKFHKISALVIFLVSLLSLFFKLYHLRVLFQENHHNK